MAGGRGTFPYPCLADTTFRKDPGTDGLKKRYADVRNMLRRPVRWWRIAAALAILVAALAASCVEQPRGGSQTLPPVSPAWTPGSGNNRTPSPAQPTGSPVLPQERTPVPSITGLPPTLAGDENLRASIRASFDTRYPVTKDTDYPLLLDTKQAAWLDLHLPDARLVQAYAKFMMPPATGTFIARKDRVYEMPEDFNAFAADSGVQITTDSDALLLADLYIKVWEPRGAFGRPLASVLNGSGDIPQRWTPVPQAVAEKISPPSVILEDEEYHVHLFTWSEVNGMTREWTMVLSRNGTVEAENSFLGQYIGDAFTLDG